MIILLDHASTIQSPLVVTLIGIGVTSLVALVGAAFKMVVQLARMQFAIGQIQSDIVEMRNDPDVMRWSNYGRAGAAFGVTAPKGAAGQ